MVVMKPNKKNSDAITINGNKYLFLLIINGLTSYFIDIYLL